MIRRLFLIILFAGIVYSGNAQNLDINTLKSVNQSRNQSLDGVMETASNTYIEVALAVPLTELIIAYTQKSKKNYRYCLENVGAYAASAVMTGIIKNALQRDRPYVTYPYALNVYQKDPSDPSMPSGHTAIAFTTATSLSLCYKRWYVVAPSFAYATLVGYSQMYLGMHYPTDVLFGALVGIGSSYISIKTTQYLRHRHNQELMLE